MTTLLDKTLKREVRIKDRAYVVTLSPQTLKLTLKGRRRGPELAWEALVSGGVALATALNASLGQLTTETVRRRRPETAHRAPGKYRVIRPAKHLVRTEGER
jgi:hypothetical protein